MSTIVSKEQQALSKKIGDGSLSRDEYMNIKKQGAGVRDAMVKGSKPETQADYDKGWAKYQSEFKGGKGGSILPQNMGSDGPGAFPSIKQMMEGQGRQFPSNGGKPPLNGVKDMMGVGVGQDFAGGARTIAQNHLNNVSLNGTGQMYETAKKKASRSLTDRQLNGDDDDEDLPIGPGYAMMTHLFNHAGGKKAIKDTKKEKLLNGANILTNSMDSVKTALQMIGVHSETNAGGLPLDIKDAMKAFYGKKELTDVEKSQFHFDVNNGSAKMDKKDVRKFVNQDGSLTWEILNKDKTVMSRFTYGDYNGAKIFAQGGYNKFAELLAKAKKELGPDNRAEFDAIRNGFGKG